VGKGFSRGCSHWRLFVALRASTSPNPALARSAAAGSHPCFAEICFPWPDSLSLLLAISRNSLSLLLLYKLAGLPRFASFEGEREKILPQLSYQYGRDMWLTFLLPPTQRCQSCPLRDWAGKGRRATQGVIPGVSRKAFLASRKKNRLS